MRRLKLLVVTLAITMLPITACQSRSDGPQPSPTEAGLDLAHSRDRSLQQMQAKLAELDVKLASLKADVTARSDKLSAESKAAMVDAIAQLEEKRAAAQQSLERARSATSEQWEQLKSRTNDTLKVIDDAYAEAARKLRD